MRHVIIASAIALTCLTLSHNDASAQDGNPTFSEPATDFNPSDRNFFYAISEGGAAEVAFGNLAADKAEADDVRAFAKRMVEDHTIANEELIKVVDKGDVPLRKALNEEHKNLFDRLEKQKGWAFDYAYMKAQVADHQKAAQLLEYEIGSGQNAALKVFAAKTLPIVMEHLQHARVIYARLTGAATD